MKTLIVNFYGGPGSGKSTAAARNFSELKDLGYNVELATEYAKDLTWQESFNVLKNQIYIFGKQQHRIWRLDGKVQIILTDSPLLLSTVYAAAETTDLFKSMVIEEYRKRPTINIFLNRTKPYNQSGRSQSEEAAIELDKKIREKVLEVDKFHLIVNGEKLSTETITEFIINEYNKLNK
jgi:endo-1,4-beta-mannosidase